MRYNRKACQRAIELAVARNDMRVIPFGLVFECGWKHDSHTQHGVRQCYSTFWRKRFGDKDCETNDDRGSVRFALAAAPFTHRSNYHSTFSLRPAVKPRSLKKHELRKQDRDLRRTKQYD